MMNIKIKFTNGTFEWYDTVKNYIADENIIVIHWWSIASQKDIYTKIEKRNIKEIKIYG